MRMVHIYILSNSENGDIFYVGATFCLKRRLGQHINDATYYSRKKLTAYLNNMNTKPIIEEIDTISVYKKEESLLLENYWIDQLRQWGFSLTNNRFNLSK